MRLTLTDEQHDLADMLQRLFADHCPSALVRAVKQQRSPGVLDSLWAALAQVGAFGLGVQPDSGGAGGSVFDAGLLFRQGGRVLCPPIVYQSVLFGLSIERLGTAAQRRAYLDPLLAGQLRATSAIADPDDGIGSRARLTAEPVAGGWILSGELRFVESAGWSELAVVCADVGAHSQPGLDQEQAFVVHLDSPGLTAQTNHLISGDHTSDLTFDRVFVPEADVLAGQRSGQPIGADLCWLRHLAVALQCMEMVGGAEAVLERTVEHVQTRHQFGRPIGSFQAVQHIVADMRISLDTARLPAYRATWLCGREPRPTVAVARAKMLCGETYKFLTWSAHQLHGGMGFIRETDLHLWSERAKLTDLQLGSPDVASGWLETELGLAASRSRPV